MLIDIYMKFREDSLNVSKLESGHDFAIDYKGNNSKSRNARVMFLRSASRLMLINIYIKFGEYSLNGFQIIERTRFCDRVQG